MALVADHRDGVGYGVDRDEILRVLRAFQDADLEYVLIGATAMAFHGVVRATEDVDLFVRATPENSERLRAALRTAYRGIHMSMRFAPRISSANTQQSGAIRPRVTCTSIS